MNHAVYSLRGFRGVQRGTYFGGGYFLGRVNTLLFCVYNESSTFYIFMLYMYILIHTVLAVEFVVVLWNRVYNLCTLYVLKGGARG